MSTDRTYEHINTLEIDKQIIQTSELLGKYIEIKTSKKIKQKLNLRR